MPTRAECEELTGDTTLTWHLPVTDEGVGGMRFTSPRVDGRSIYLAGARYYSGGALGGNRDGWLYYYLASRMWESWSRGGCVLYGNSPDWFGIGDSSSTAGTVRAVLGPYP